MPDMDAFERLVAREAVRDVGPVRPVDDLALFEVAARRAPQWSFASLVSASKLVVAGAIVALFGGLLLVGTLTQPSEERQPAAVTDSPAPTTGDGLLPGVDLVTEEVEPGVFRVLSDGVRDLSGIGPRRARGHSAPDGLAIGPDGAIWVVPIGETTELVRLGDPTSYPHPSSSGSR